MTTQDLINYYADLLILQYKNKEKAYATIQAFVAPAIMDQLTTQVLNAFQVDSAQGVQLDVIGKYVGVTRSGSGFVAPITLDDNDFSILIQLGIIKNNSDGTLYSIQSLMTMFFPNEIVVFDHLKMRMSVLIDSAQVSQDLVQLFLTEGLFPKPMAVQLSPPIYYSPIDTFYGWRTYLAPAHNVTPLNSYSDYQSGRPWLSYANAVVF